MKLTDHELIAHVERGGKIRRECWTKSAFIKKLSSITWIDDLGNDIYIPFEWLSGDDWELIPLETDYHRLAALEARVDNECKELWNRVWKLEELENRVDKLSKKIIEIEQAVYDPEIASPCALVEQKESEPLL